MSEWLTATDAERQTHTSKRSRLAQLASKTPSLRRPISMLIGNQLPQRKLQATRLCTTYIFTGVAACERSTLGTIAAAALCCCAVAFLHVLASDMHIMVLGFRQSLACCADPLLFDLVRRLQDSAQQTEMSDCTAWVHRGVAGDGCIGMQVQACMQCSAP